MSIRKIQNSWGKIYNKGYHTVSMIWWPLPKTQDKTMVMATPLYRKDSGGIISTWNFFSLIEVPRPTTMILVWVPRRSHWPMLTLVYPWVIFQIYLFMTYLYNPIVNNIFSTSNFVILLRVIKEIRYQGKPEKLS